MDGALANKILGNFDDGEAKIGHVENSSEAMPSTMTSAGLPSIGTSFGQP